MLYTIDSETQRHILKSTCEVFRAFTECPRKPILEFARTKPAKNVVDDFYQARRAIYRRAAIEHYLSKCDLSVSVMPLSYCRPLRFIEDLDTESAVIEIGGPYSGRSGKIGAEVVPVIYVPARKITKNTKLLLAYNALLAHKLSGTIPSFGKIVHGQTFRETRIQLAGYSSEVRKLVGALIRYGAESSEPPLILNRNCSSCRFSHQCRSEASATDNLSQLSTLSEKEIIKLNKRGILTVTQLSYTFRPRRRGRRSKKPEKHSAALKALAIRTKHIYVQQRPVLPTNKIRIFLDIEGLPDDQFYYLIGLKICDGKSETRHHFWADSVCDEERIWYQFLSTLAATSDFSVFHYGSYDAKFVDAMYKRHGGESVLPSEQLRSVLVNVLKYCYSDIYFPSYSNGLKDIASYLGFEWNETDASGLQSIVWRESWEQDRDETMRARLIQYNQQDCDALQLVTEIIAAIVDNQELQVTGLTAVSTETIKRWNPYKFGKHEFATRALEYINKCAYSDYQRTKVFWRTDRNVRKSNKRKMNRGPPLRPNKTITFARPKACVRCKRGHVSKNGIFSRTFFDLKFSGSNVKRWVTRLEYHQYRCQDCKATFYPEEHIKYKSKYGRGLLVWVVYQNIGLHQSYGAIMTGLSELFGFSQLKQNRTVAKTLKASAAVYYSEAYDEIRENIRGGNLVHVDETLVNLKGGVGYVWVFACLEEVIYVYSNSRESRILADTLRGFSGVLVSDFYAGYDSFPVEQQRCLVHMIRDLNDSLFKNPFDKELKEFVVQFGVLLKSIVETIDRYGLKRRFLRKHKKEVAAFYRTYVNRKCGSEPTAAYQVRFKRNENRLFTFLDHDGVPWNNNNAEVAIKGFAVLRRAIGGASTEVGIIDTLKLLSISQTLKNKNASFFEFLRSGKSTISEFLSEDNA